MVCDWDECKLAAAIEAHPDLPVSSWVVVTAAALRMNTWADAHPECDTQGIMPDEWAMLAASALGILGWDDRLP